MQAASVARTRTYSTITTGFASSTSDRSLWSRCRSDTGHSISPALFYPPWRRVHLRPGPWGLPQLALVQPPHRYPRYCRYSPLPSSPGSQRYPISPGFFARSPTLFSRHSWQSSPSPSISFPQSLFLHKCFLTPSSACRIAPPFMSCKPCIRSTPSLGSRASPG